jgi:adenylosuccinate synthase
MSAIVVVDAFWGDSGKGKIASYLAQRRKATICVRAGTGTNAGHSLYVDDNTVIKTHQIPLAGLLSGAQLRVGSGVAVDPRLFFEEIGQHDPAYAVTPRTKIDARCPVILPEYIQQERDSPHLRTTVGSTCSGTGVAQAEFCLRTAKQARDIAELAPYTTDVAREINEACSRGECVIVEGSQGTFLSLALSRDYPCCTSGNCTTAALADDVGLNWQHIGHVVLIVKALPSRVGEGALPFEMTVNEQDRRGIAEFGVRTGRRRRKASEIDWDLLKESVMLNGPTEIALTFCDHYHPQIRGSKTITPPVRALIDKVTAAAGVPVTLVETGKRYDEIIEVER